MSNADGDWRLEYRGYEPAQEGLREALCTLGNGYFATRGAAPEAHADGIHYPGTYLAGCYDREQTEVAGRPVESEDLVNLPNWLPLRLRVAGGDWLEPRTAELLDYRQSLDLRAGLLERTLRARDGAGRVTRVAQRRLVHMAEPHLAVLEMAITAENWSGTVELESALDGGVENAGVVRYRALERRHLERLASSAEGDRLELLVRTRQSPTEVAMAARTRLFRGEERVPAEFHAEEAGDRIAQRFTIALAEGETARVEKVVALHTSHDRAISAPLLASRTALERVGDFRELLEPHARAWDDLWHHFELSVELAPGWGGGRMPLVLRLHLFHLMQTASPHTTDLDVGIPARGWTGEAYRGHVFWDELFVLPVLHWRLPEVARSLLLYRYRRLGEARASARASGLRGALYPWQSGSDGREESARLHLNPRSGRWVRDDTHLQRHVNAAIAYNVWQYYQVTGDVEFLSLYGAEVLLEIARLLASLATLDERLGRYRIHGVVGPDEFHTAYPEAEVPGIDDNAYTNVMASWAIARALDALEALPADRRGELSRALELSDEEIGHWRDVSHRMRIPIRGDGIIEPFEGYGRLAELDWSHYRALYGDIHRLDRILEAEGDSVNRYQVSKQADVLMLLYLFSAEELGAILDRLGYQFHPESIPANVGYHSARTSHGSTLSRVVHSWVMARGDRQRSLRLLEEALASDVADVQGGTTAEGIHLGAMAGTVDVLLRGYTGIEARSGVLWLNPCLPDEIATLGMSIRYRGARLVLRFAGREVEVSELGGAALDVGMEGKVRRLEAGGVLRLAVGGARGLSSPAGRTSTRLACARAGRRSAPRRRALGARKPASLTPAPPWRRGSPRRADR